MIHIVEQVTAPVPELTESEKVLGLTPEALAEAADEAEVERAERYLRACEAVKTLRDAVRQDRYRCPLHVINLVEALDELEREGGL